MFIYGNEHIVMIIIDDTFANVTAQLGETPASDWQSLQW